jgi:hypothetical protein
MKPQQHKEVLENYTFQKDKPFFSASNYTIWHGSQKESNLAVTIKMLKFPHVEVPKYLKKLKEVRSEFVIKIFELSVDSSSVLIVT